MLRTCSYPILTGKQELLLAIGISVYLWSENKLPISVCPGIWLVESSSYILQTFHRSSRSNSHTRDMFRNWPGRWTCFSYGKIQFFELYKYKSCFPIEKSSFSYGKKTWCHSSQMERRSSTVAVAVFDMIKPQGICTTGDSPKMKVPLCMDGLLWKIWT